MNRPWFWPLVVVGPVVVLEIAVGVAQPGPPPEVVCSSVPAADTLNGAVGTGTPCLRMPTDSRPTAVQAANVTADASGNWSVTWARPFISSTPAMNAVAIQPSSGLPIVCGVVTRSSTDATGRCLQASQSSSNISLGVLPLTVTLNPFPNAAANAALTVFAREPTQ